ncbi:MAG: chemotaxis protein CheA [Novosphingobium sp. 28-62-57]|uniref:chemotaxis protein CheA n=1 Tax=unclassified Novosphingobium TaxID=2644732 RepID=UPI000BDBDF8B|nr:MULTISPECIES: chemotaxis protein CheA [unclassified Novosphingobium]OYW47675.1 MAG: chemotaxis protein CheA [Novosphingobium sp. 12-63-9]OYZ08418.1 MAG: chemotaxis protein CheA [Novosphingobium sp. 28-62-57]HQS69290.1 chemotaxis protein CheA [Novosphingobium sp.]
MTPEEIQQIFFVECEESLAAAEAGLAACRDGTQDDDTVNSVFRAVHSIKGGAGAFGYAGLQAYTHTFETLLSDVRDGSVPLSETLCSLLLRALDTLSDHVTAAQEGTALPDDAALLAELSAAQANGAPAEKTPAPVEAKTEAPAAPAAPAVADDDDDDLAGAEIDLDALLDDLVGPAPTAEPATAAAAPAPGWQLHLHPHAGAMRNGAEPMTLLRELASMGARCVSCNLSHLPGLDMLDCEQGYLGFTYELPASVAESDATDVFDFVRDDWGIAVGNDAAMPPVEITAKQPASEAAAVAVVPPVAPVQADAPDAVPAAAAPATTATAAAAAAASSAPVAPAAGQSIRIDLAKLDRLIDTVGEMVIAQAMLAQRLEGDTAAKEELQMLEGLTRDIQESAMSIRAQPISSVFSRVPRILRELAVSTGKHVRLEVLGETTELDKTVLERLGEPLTHLIRNAVDHGIESADQRLAAGKPAEGTLTLSAEQRSGRILIKVADDGKGIDRARVLEKAIAQGIVAAENQLTPEDIDHLIFAPGFSTAQTVTSVSGRGVGMDVVRQNVKNLGGRITIESEAGVGTTFTLALPLTLAISDGMIVNVGDQTLVVPLTHVVESLRPTAQDVQGLGTARQMLNVRGRFVPIISVAQQTGYHGKQVQANEGVLIIVDTQVAGQAALLVDTISDQRQFVIKSLEANYRAVEGVAGATILGDGRVALILDVDSLVGGALGHSSAIREAA